MDFFDRQEAAQRATTSLIVYFGLAMLLTVGLVVGLVYLILQVVSMWLSLDESAWIHRDQWGALAMVGAFTAAFIGLVSRDKIRELARGGGDAVARMLNGTLIPRDTTEPDLRVALNVTEEMALAAGVAPPPVYLLAHEDGVNAFAAGYAPHSAVIGLTRGAVELLSRDELQGVVGHELSHVINGDMRLNIRLMGLIHGVTCIGMAGKAMVLHSFSRSPHGGKRNRFNIYGVLMGASLMAVGCFGSFLGGMLKASICRQREYLADAASVQFTRNPAGVVGALEVMGGWRKGSALDHPKAAAASHMYIGQHRATFMRRLLATHPPLEERIRRINPLWRGAFPRVDEAFRATRAHARQAEVPHLMRMDDERSAPAEDAEPPSSSEHEGATLQAAYLTRVRHLRAALPETIRHAAANAATAPLLLLALLLDRDPAAQAQQLDILLERADVRVHDRVLALAEQLAAVEPAARLLCMEMAIPAMRSLEPDAYETFKADALALIYADNRVNLFEWMCYRGVKARLEPHFNASDQETSASHIHSIREIDHDTAVLLAALAHAGVSRTEHGDDAEADPEPTREAAFRAGVTLLGQPAVTRPGREATDLPAIDAALKRCARMTPALKRRLLEAAAAVIRHDGRVTQGQGELLRAVADGLDCPMPPLLPGQAIPPFTAMR